MNTPHAFIRNTIGRSRGLLLYMLLVCASSAHAQSMPSMDMSGMDMGRPAAAGSTAAPARPSSPSTTSPQPSSSPQPHDDMPSMQKMPGTSMPAQPALPTSGEHDDVSGMPMGPMQGGRAPADARSGDYSDGIGYGAMRGMDMQDNARQSMLLVDQLEAFDGKQANGQRWEVEGWYGNDNDKLWLRSEGERSGGRLDDGDIELLWNHVIASFWSSQLGVRHDLGQGPNRDWIAFGVQGLLPYWFELEATGYVSDAGRTAARLRAEYELRFTQKLILQPEFEVNLYGKSDPARRIGSGVSDADLGLRLRYEINRQFAPYVGIVWTRRFGDTADFARSDNHDGMEGQRFDRQWVAGIRFWF